LNSPCLSAAAAVTAGKYKGVMFGQMAQGAGGHKKIGEMYLIVQLYVRSQFVNTKVVTIMNIAAIGRRLDYFGDFGDGLFYNLYVLSLIAPADHLRASLNLARIVMIQAVYDEVKELPCGGDVALVADYLMEMQSAVASLGEYQSGLVGRGIWDSGGGVAGGGGGGGGGVADSVEETSRRGELRMVGFRKVYQARFDQPIEERYEVSLNLLMKMHHKVQEGLTSSGLPDFHTLADLPLTKMKRRNVGGREVKDSPTRLSLGERNTLVSQVKMGRDEVFNTAEKVWDALARYLMTMNLLTIHLKDLGDPVRGRCLVDMNVGMVGNAVNYACFVVAKELDQFVRDKGQYLLLVNVVKVAEYVMESVSNV